MTIYHNPKNEQMIEELYVALSLDEGGEGIFSIQTMMGGMPVVFGNKRLLEPFMSVLKQAVKDTGKTIRIFKFKKESLIEEIICK